MRDREDSVPPDAIEHVQPRALKPLLIVLATVLIIAGYFLFKDIRSLGIWDPYELTLADLGCHRAASKGAFDLAKCGLDGAKHVELRPVMMVESVRWGFQLFGVSEAAGRVPLALWALLGVLSATLAVGRLVDARAGLFTGIALITMPLYLIQGRLILGDAATMGAFAMALSGLAVAAFDRHEDGTPTTWGERAPWALLGALGIAAGIGSRGYAVGCAPAAAVGLAWLVRTANVDRDEDPRASLAVLCCVAIMAAAIVTGIKLAPLELGRTMLQPASTRSIVGAAFVGAVSLAWIRGSSAERAERAIVGAALAVGMLGIAEGLQVAFHSEDGKFIAAVGGAAQSTRKFPTYDLMVRQIAHGLFPWSCFAPFAIGRALARPAVPSVSAARREVDLRIAALVAAALCFGVQTLVAPQFGLSPYAGAVALAVLIGVVLRDLERAPAGSLAVAIGTAVLAFLVFNDFNFEDLSKTPVELATAPLIEPYGLYGVSVPEELRLKLKLVLAGAAALFLIPIFFVWVDEDPRPGWTRIERLRKPIDTAIAMWRHPYHGLLILLAGSFEVCIALAGLFTLKKNLRRLVPQLQALNLAQRDLLVNLWWYVLAGVVVAYLGYIAFLYGRDAFRALRRQRVATIAIGGLVAGGIWAYGVMPAVANQFS
ncbi:MAG: glycosyltransferase family 39 protein, partial [Polyangiales bacterium]